ncbi:uncharacterized protein LOC111498037 isoform X1 [Cucurbita maxima]|uniref:Uncharacterized protein LOC111498037 isoform X1 n=2 Tax=Cucurbita maxima TaxID=3661 RepID=A0A6J1L0P9_CUCMA|nr:uncharacterized protein LOC111498037 isoform X1 [Cucurbita maxima]
MRGTKGAMDPLTFLQWLCCGWTCVRECCACCGCLDPNPGDAGDRNGSQNIWINNICNNCWRHCNMCFYGACRCCNCCGDQNTNQSHSRVEQNNDKSLQANNNGAQPNEIIPIQGNGINPEIIGDNNELELNVVHMHSSKSDLDLPSLDLKSGNQNDLNFNPKILGSGNKIKVNVARMYPWKSFPESRSLRNYGANC